LRLPERLFYVIFHLRDSRIELNPRMVEDDLTVWRKG